MRIAKTTSFLASTLVLALFLPGCSSEPSDGTLTVEEITVGTGATVVNGDTVTVTYVGRLTNGTQFDANSTGFTFRVGVGQVIKGWEQGLIGMRVGGRRRLTIPPNLGYGSQGNGSIPANSTLIFEIGLLAIAGK